jgi:hypothetical protein
MCVHSSLSRQPPETSLIHSDDFQVNRSVESRIEESFNLFGVVRVQRQREPDYGVNNDV